MAPRALPKTGPRRCRVLYVEHDAESLAQVEQLVAASKDLLLIRAADLHLAVQVARREQPEVILIDIDLPDFDVARGASDILKLLRADPAMDAMPILALSANAAPAAIMKGLEAGFFHYLTKPIQAAAFAEALAFAREFAAVEQAEQAGMQPRPSSRTAA